MPSKRTAFLPFLKFIPEIGPTLPYTSTPVLAELGKRAARAARSRSKPAVLSFPDSNEPGPSSIRPRARSQRPSTPSTLIAAAGPESPSMSTRSRSRPSTPSTLIAAAGPESPSMSTRSRSRPATPSTLIAAAGPESLSMSTRSRSRPATPSTPTAAAAEDSPSMSTRSRSRPATPSTPTAAAAIDSPSMSTRSRSRPATPPVTVVRSDPCSGPPLPRPSSANQPVPVVRPTASRIKCPECPNTLANQRTFQVHKKMHTMKRLVSRAAKPEEFMEKLPSLICSALDSLMKEKFVGLYAEDMKLYSEQLKVTFLAPEDDHNLLVQYLHQHLYSILISHSSVFSSSLVYTFYVGINSLLNNLTFKEELIKLIVSLGDVELPKTEVVELFVGNFMLVLSSEVVIYFIRLIHGATDTEHFPRKRSPDDSDSRTFHELVYYIAGSVVSGLLFKGNKYKESSPTWELFSVVLEKKFLRSEVVGNACSQEVSHFTESVDRGKLKHISQEAFDFFVILFDFLMSLEGNDGTLPQDVIDNYVLKNDTVLCLWDVLIGTEMDDDTSLDFLVQTCNTCKLIVMKGIMKRRLNDNLQKAVAAVSLRCKLA